MGGRFHEKALVEALVIRRYFLTQYPARVTRTTKGTIEFVGVLKGHNESLPDPEGFSSLREQVSAKRYAAFGDSHTAAPFPNENWPDHEGKAWCPAARGLRFLRLVAVLDDHRPRSDDRGHGPSSDGR